jgi:hypothetical protein
MASTYTRFISGHTGLEFIECIGLMLLIFAIGRKKDVSIYPLRMHLDMLLQGNKANKLSEGISCLYTYKNENIQIT